MCSEVNFLKAVIKKGNNEGGGGRKPSPQAPVEKCTYMATRFTVPRHAWTPTCYNRTCQPCHRVPIDCESLSLFFVICTPFYFKTTLFLMANWRIFPTKPLFKKSELSIDLYFFIFSPSKFEFLCMCFGFDFFLRFCDFVKPFSHFAGNDFCVASFM